jgi:hypothetical protein
MSIRHIGTFNEELQIEVDWPKIKLIGSKYMRSICSSNQPTDWTGGQPEQNARSLSVSCRVNGAGNSPIGLEK